MKYKHIWIIIILLIFLSFSCYYVYADIADTIRAAYTFDTDGSDYYGVFDGDVSGPNNVPGKINNGYYFTATGNNRINFTSGANFSQCKTINAWVKQNRSIGDASSIIWSSQTTSNGAPKMQALKSDGSVTIRFATSGGEEEFATSYDLPNNEWVMLTMVHNDSQNQLILYVNGSYHSNYSTAAVTHTTQADTVSTKIGGWYGHTLNDWGGYIDEVTFYTGVLNNTEISDLYNGGDGLQPPFVLDLNISNYNMTSDGGCTIWNTNKTAPCNTTDGTPTVTFSTTLTSNCSIRNVAHEYNSSFDCSTTLATSHICTIYSAEVLSYGLDDIFVSCTGSDLNTNSTALKVNLSVAGCTGGAGLVDCITTLGTGCGVSISDNCAVITNT